MNLYLVLDVPAEKIYSAFLAETDADALRGMLFQLTRQKPKRDLKFIRACEVDVKKFDKNFFKEFKFDDVDMDHYHFEEQIAEKLSKTQVAEELAMQKKIRELEITRIQNEIDAEKKKLGV